MSEWTCAFCGRADVPRTREHVLRKDFLGKIPHVTGVRITKDVPSFPERGIRQIDFPLTNFDMTINEVCGPCNNGWMNDLESEVEDVVVDLANGRIRDLTGPEVKSLRFWMAKTALVKSLQVREAPRFSKLLSEMYRRQQTPKGVAVQFAVCKGAAPNPVGRHMWEYWPPNGRTNIEPYRLDVVNFGVGQLFFMVTLPGGKVMADWGHRGLKVARNNGQGWNFLPEGDKRPLRLNRALGDPKIAYMNGSVFRQAFDQTLDVWDTQIERPPVSIGCAVMYTDEEIELLEAGFEVEVHPSRYIMWNRNDPSTLDPEYPQIAEMLERESVDNGPHARRERRRRRA